MIEEKPAGVSVTHIRAVTRESGVLLSYTLMGSEYFTIDRQSVSKRMKLEIKNMTHESHIITYAPKPASTSVHNPRGLFI